MVTAARGTFQLLDPWQSGGGSAVDLLHRQVAMVGQDALGEGPSVATSLPEGGPGSTP
jgi:hypothetical protein